MDKKIRMADIAAQVGVSVVTVSKALSGKDGVSEEMRETIKKLASDMGYVPLRSKPAVEKTAPSGTIGILMARRFFADNSFYSELYRQVLMCCNAQGFSALLELIPPEAESGTSLPAIIQGRKADALIFMGELRREYIQNVVKSGLPYILLDFYDEELNADSVTSDNISGGYRLTNHLLQTGRTEIGFVGSIHATSSIMDRFLGYMKAMLQANIPLRPEWVLEDRDETGILVPVELPEKMPQAFLCSYDEVAYELIAQLRAAGFRVPEDVAVAGYDDYLLGQLCVPPLTTYRVNKAEMSQVAVNQLIRQLNGKQVTKGNVVVSGQFIRREST